MAQPRISVIMPAYNCEMFIGKAIDSILGQTFADFELVVCDDGSTDDTWKKIDSYTDPRIRKYRNNVNKGYLVTYNYLLTLASGALITCQDADDWSELTRLEMQAKVFDTHPDVHLCGVNGTFFYTDSIQKPCPSYEDGYVTNTEKPNSFILAAIMYRREVLDKVKGFNPYFDRATSMDQYFILDILANFKGYAIGQYLYFARFNTTSNHRGFEKGRKLTSHEAFLMVKEQRLATGSDWLLEKREADLLEYERKFLKDRKFMAEKYREYAVYRIDANQPRQSVPLLMRSLWLNPLHFITYRTVLFGLRKAIAGK